MKTEAELIEENEYLRSVLAQLIVQIQEDVQVDSVTEHFWEAVDVAEEALWGEKEIDEEVDEE